MDKQEIEEIYQSLRVLRRTKRIAVLDLLKEKSMNVSEIQQAIKKSHSETSQILKDLRDLNLVEGIRSSQYHVEYSLRKKTYETWDAITQGMLECLSTNKA